MCINLKGGVTNNIPNDNGIELQVKNIKKTNSQGVNKTFDSSQKVCMTTQVIEDIKLNLINKTKCVQSKRHRPDVDKTKDILAIIKCIRNEGIQNWTSLKKYKNPLSSIDAVSLHSWIK